MEGNRELRNLKFHDKIVVRIPSLPATGLYPANLLETFLHEKFNSEALFIASPDLHAECIRLLNSPENFSEKDAVRIKQSLLKYYLRMKNRCTPFGLFAGCGCVTWGTENSVIIEPGYHRYTRLDMHFQGALSAYLSRQNSLRDKLLFYPNNSIYTLHDKLRYIEYYYSEKRKVFKISSVDNSEILEKVLLHSTNGIILNDLADLITDDEIAYEDALSFLNELVEEQILVSEFFPGVTGTDNFESYKTRIESLAEGNDSINDLNNTIRTISESIKNLDVETGRDIDEYENIINVISRFNIPTDKNKLYQVDMMRKVRGTVKKDVTDKIIEIIGLLGPLSLKGKNSSLEKFKERFTERYETREISLPFAIDNETGIGYSRHTGQNAADNLLVDDLLLPGTAENYRVEETDRILLSILIEALNNRKHSVDLAEIAAKLKNYANTEFRLPATFSVMYRIFNEVGSEKLYLEILGGTSAANIIGRFAYASDELKQVLSDINQFEEKKHHDAIVAEIIHLPENRTGNILFRPVFRNYEIPYLAKSSVNNDFQLTISDLFLRIINGRLVLRSKSLNREIIPRLSNAHNYHFGSLPLYNLLCDLQSQDLCTALNFSWGSLASAFEFLPRVSYKDIIVFPARWKFNKSDLQKLIENCKSGVQEALKKWKEQWSLPEYVVITDSDNELLIEFRDEESCALFLSILKKKDSLELSECMTSQDPSQNIVMDDNGRHYSNQFLAFIFNEDYNFTASNFSDAGSSVKRTYSVGSEWLYFKFYCGTKTADRILTESILPLINTLTENKWIEKWFFIRYWDPESHLRLRLYMPDANHSVNILNYIQNYFEEYQKSGLIWKIQMDTYERELERYGAENIENSENIFCVDSIFTLRFLDLIEGPEGEELRLLYGMQLMDDYLNCFDYSIDGKIDFTEKMKTSFLTEFKADKNLRVQMDDRFRKFKKKMETFFDDEELKLNFPEINELLITRRAQLSQIINTIYNEADPQMTESLLFSYIHMTMNRLFTSKQRVVEMLIYYLMNKYYGSQKAILNKKTVKDEIPAF
jgi:thiopeptide-type bacteriocin biosynthesis protein